MKSFLDFLLEKDSSYDLVQSGINDKSLDNKTILTTMNAALAKATALPFITPYIGLGSIAKTLAYCSVIVPQYHILDKMAGEVIWPAEQFGKLMGVCNQANPIDKDPEWFVYFCYEMLPNGYYSCFAAIVSASQLNALMAAGEN